jgi:hypothetical protein
VFERCQALIFAIALQFVLNKEQTFLKYDVVYTFNVGSSFWHCFGNCIKNRLKTFRSHQEVRLTLQFIDCDSTYNIRSDHRKMTESKIITKVGLAEKSRLRVKPRHDFIGRIKDC